MLLQLGLMIMIFINMLAKKKEVSNIGLFESNHHWIIKVFQFSSFKSIFIYSIMSREQEKVFKCFARGKILIKKVKTAHWIIFNISRPSDWWSWSWACGSITTSSSCPWSGSTSSRLPNLLRRNQKRDSSSCLIFYLNLTNKGTFYVNMSKL